MNRYFINDFSMVNALGNDKATILHHWIHGLCPGLIKTDKFSPGIECCVFTVKNDLPKIPSSLKIYNCRNNRLLMAAYEGIEKTALHFIKRYGAQRIGVVLGTSTSGIREAELALTEKVRTGVIPDFYHFKTQDIGTCSDFLSAFTGVTGPSVTISTACSSSANAFNTARRLMEQDICDAVIVGGADSLCKMTVQGFLSLSSVSPEQCQPFSRNRKGITIGESSALFVLSREPASLELYGVSSSSDANHISAPSPDGLGACETMRGVFDQSPFGCEQLDYLNLHGTATKLNDAMESRAVNRVFGTGVLCSSTKSLTGHTLGAAAATEIGLCCLLLSGLNTQGVVPAQRWDGQYDGSLPSLKIADGCMKPEKLKLCLSNSFAFGGNNVSVLVGREYGSF